MIIPRGMTKFIFMGHDDQFVVSLKIGQQELRRRLLELLEEYEDYEIGTAA